MWLNFLYAQIIINTLFVKEFKSIIMLIILYAKQFFDYSLQEEAIGQFTWQVTCLSMFPQKSTEIKFLITCFFLKVPVLCNFLSSMPMFSLTNLLKLWLLISKTWFLVCKSWCWSFRFWFWLFINYIRSQIL